jgi:hypothetical protein
VYPQFSIQYNAPLITLDQRGVSFSEAIVALHRLVDEQFALDELAVAVFAGNDGARRVCGWAMRRDLLEHLGAGATDQLGDLVGAESVSRFAWAFCVCQPVDYVIISQTLGS